jgi:hypothetical protein
MLNHQPYQAMSKLASMLARFYFYQDSQLWYFTPKTQPLTTSTGFATRYLVERAALSTHHAKL